MNKKVAVCVFGVNGVGKSVLLKAFSGMYPDSIVVRGSTILKESLSVASYEALESMSADVKKRVIIDGISTLVKSSQNEITVIDTHLVVPIRKSGVTVIEDMWDDQLLECFQGFVYVQAHPDVISERRQTDSDRVLRVLNASSQICAEDLRLNALRWDEVCQKMRHKKVVVNDQSVLVGAMKISHFVESL